MRKKAILTKKAPLPIGPYNQAIQFDNLLNFVMGTEKIEDIEK